MIAVDLRIGNSPCSMTPDRGYTNSSCPLGAVSQATALRDARIFGLAPLRHGTVEWNSGYRNFKESRRIDGQAGQLESREKRVLLVSRRDD